jgi:cell fate (sporulation/competence/biofilm development) regulator YlbF (YheA/YmcA/DUF963 family)
MTETVIFPVEFQAATDSLIQNLLAAEPFLAYHQSQAQIEADPQTRGLLQHLSVLQARLRRKQADGSVTEAELGELSTVQAQVRANATITDYAQTQQEAVNFLREINQEISSLLGVDFASLARQSSCC